MSSDALALIRIRDAVTRAKIELSRASVAVVHVPFISLGGPRHLHLKVNLTRKLYDELTADLIDQTLNLTRQVLRDAGPWESEYFVKQSVVVGRAGLP